MTEQTEVNWVEHMGLEWDEQSPSRMRAQLAANEIGVAGVVGVSNTTDFLRSHKEGRVDALGTPVFVGRTQQLWTVEITRPSDGKLLARGQVRLQNLTVLPQDR